MDNRAPTTYNTTQAAYIAEQEAIISELQKRIVSGFNTLDYYAMEKLKDGVIYRRKLIGLARSGKFLFLQDDTNNS